MITSEKREIDLAEAVDEAHAFGNRRNSPRIHQDFNAEMSPWENGRAGVSFGVVVEDFSTTGVGIRHTDRLREGARYLLEIPRAGATPLTSMLKVVRCDETAGGCFEVELTPGDVLEVAAEVAYRRNPHPSNLRKLHRRASAAIATAAAAVS